MSKIVTTHLVWKSSEITPCNSNWIIREFDSLSYNSFPEKCDLLSHMEYFEHSIRFPYPPNTMRNIARRGSLTDVQLISDIENHFCDNAAAMLSQVAQNVTSKMVIGIRRFEYEEDAVAPKNAKYLKNLMDKEQ